MEKREILIDEIADLQRRRQKALNDGNSVALYEKEMGRLADEYLISYHFTGSKGRQCGGCNDQKRC